MIAIIPYVAYMLLAACYSSQIYRTYKLKSAYEVSYIFLTAMFVALILLQIYFAFLRDFNLIIGNGVCLVETGILICLKVYYDYKANY